MEVETILKLTLPLNLKIELLKSLKPSAEHNRQCNKEIGIMNFDILASGFKNYWEKVSYEALMIKQLCPKINIQNAT